MQTCGGKRVLSLYIGRTECRVSSIFQPFFGALAPCARICKLKSEQIAEILSSAPSKKLTRLLPIDFRALRGWADQYDSARGLLAEHAGRGLLDVFSSGGYYARARFCQADLSFSSAREAAEMSARASASYPPKLRLSVMARLSVSGIASEAASEGSSVAVTL